MSIGAPYSPYASSVLVSMMCSNIAADRNSCTLCTHATRPHPRISRREGVEALACVGKSTNPRQNESRLRDALHVMRRNPLELQELVLVHVRERAVPEVMAQPRPRHRLDFVVRHVQLPLRMSDLADQQLRLRARSIPYTPPPPRRHAHGHAVIPWRWFPKGGAGESVHRPPCPLPAQPGASCCMYVRQGTHQIPHPDAMLEALVRGARVHLQRIDSARVCSQGSGESKRKKQRAMGSMRRSSIVQRALRTLVNPLA